MRASASSPGFSPALVTGVVLAVLGSPAAAGDAPRTLEVTLPAAEMPARAGEPVVVTIRARNADGSPAPGLRLHLDTTAGSFANVEDVGDGSYLTALRLPDQNRPQAILLAAFAEGAWPATAVLRLVARVDLPVRTDKPRVKVSLVLRGRSFGPVQADDQGRALVPIEVGPGDTQAVVVGVDEFGNQTRRPVEIPIPPAPRLVGFASRSGLAADGRDAVELYLAAIEPDGSPAREIRLTAVRKAGKLGAIEPLAPGLVRVRFTGPSRLDRPRLTLTLGLKGDDKASSREFAFTLAAGRPSRLTAKAAPTRLKADGRAKAEIELALTDAAGNPLEGHPLRLRCSPGAVGALESRPRGGARAEYRAPLGVSGQATCVAELVEDPAVRAELRLVLEPQVPARLVLSLGTPRLPMDGTSQSRIDVEVFDEDGLRLPGVPLVIEAPLGGVDQVTEDGDGRYHATFTAPRGDQDTRLRVEVTAGTPPGTVSDELVLELKGVRPPPPPLPWISLGPSAAYMTNFGLLSWAGASLQLDARLPGAADVLYLGLELGYRRGWSRDDLEGGGEAAVDLDAFPVHLLFLVKPLPHAPLTPVLGVGGGGSFVRWSAAAPGGVAERDHAALWSSLAVVGVEIPAGQGSFAVLARYLYAYLDDRAADGGSRVRGSVGGLDVSLGYRLCFR